MAVDEDIREELTKLRAALKTCLENPRYNERDRLDLIAVSLCRLMEILSAGPTD